MGAISKVSVEKGNSFYDFIEKYCLEKILGGHSNNRAFHRLCSLLRKMDVKTAVVERLRADRPEVSEECAALKARIAPTVKFRIFKFTFTRKALSKLKELAGFSDDDFLASVIFVNFTDDKGGWRSYVFQAVLIRPRVFRSGELPRPLLNNYLHIQKDFECSVAISADIGKQFVLRGSFFCQQNQFTSVCAHASLLMTINNMSIPTLGIVSAEFINKIVKIDHRSTRLDPAGDRSGLSREEVLDVLKACGLSIKHLDVLKNPNEEYDEFVYKYLESKCPVLLAFTTDLTQQAIGRHVVPVLGHTLNSDMWRPEAEEYLHPVHRLNYKASSSWIDHFVIHDDNFGMYFCLPVGALKRITLPKHDPTFRVCDVIAVVPPSVTTPAWEAEYASVVVTKDFIRQGAALGSLDLWTERLAVYPRSMVVRTFLVQKTDYLASLGGFDFAGNVFTAADKIVLTEDLPDRFWLSEITLPDLYCANKNKIIDFFYGCDHGVLRNYNDVFKRWIQVRFPFVVSKRTASSAPTMTRLGVESHYPLLRLVDEDDNEW